MRKAPSDKQRCWSRGVTRWRRQLDYIIANMTGKSADKLEDRIKHVRSRTLASEALKACCSCVCRAQRPPSCAARVSSNPKIESPAQCYVSAPPWQPAGATSGGVRDRAPQPAGSRSL